MNIHEFTSIYTQISTAIQTEGLIAGMNIIHKIFPDLTLIQRHGFAKSEIFETALTQFQQNRAQEIRKLENSPEAREWYQDKKGF